jgi:coenzyme F420-0:L-glutamate ligase/coenzyme F420-1:gamma-L-glutamate ligase
MSAPALQIFALDGYPEGQPGDDVAALIMRIGFAFAPGDILVVTQKVVSKAEGRLVDFREVQPSDLAVRFATVSGKDPRHVEVVLRESVRIVRMAPAAGLIISETQHGFVCANAGVDLSNVRGYEVACLLPLDPDASARRIHEVISAKLGFAVPVIISDSFGRPWRNGIVNVAIGVAGMNAIVDYRGQTDAHGYEMHASIMAVADELACAAELVMGKIDARPLAVIRGYQYQPAAGTMRDLLLPPERDLFK